MEPRHETRGDVAALAAAVLDEEGARQEAEALAKEQVIFPDDLLPGVNSEPVSFREAFARGGKLMFIVLGLLLALDELEGAAIQGLGPEIRATFHISSGAIVFLGSASAWVFLVRSRPTG